MDVVSGSIGGGENGDQRLPVRSDLIEHVRQIAVVRGDAEPIQLRQGIVMKPPLLSLEGGLRQVGVTGSVSDRHDDVGLIPDENLFERGIGRIAAAVEPLLLVLFHDRSD